MIGRLVLSSRNIYKINIDNKNRSCRKCILLSNNDNSDEILIPTNKEFSPRDEYILLDRSNKIKNVLGQVGNKEDDMNIYHYLYTKDWMSNTQYRKLWNNYNFENYDIITRSESSFTDRIDYYERVLTIDPDGSIDLDDGFTFKDDEYYYYLDIHIADPISYFNLEDEIMINIFKELLLRINTCYIPNTKEANEPIHLLPSKLVNIISLLEIKKDDTINYKRGLSFIFKINKINKNVEFQVKPSKLYNIKNTTYDKYDKKINSDNEKKETMVDFINLLIDIMHLNYLKININEDISHKMIEIFMIFVNYYSGKYFESNSYKMIVREQEKYNNSDIDNQKEMIDIKNIPEYAHQFLNHSANYKLTDSYDNYHYSLGINNYCHVSSPMRRVIDMINHMIIYNIDISNISNMIDINYINNQIKIQKKINNSYELIKFLNNNNTNKFIACIYDFNVNNDFTNLLLIIYNYEYNFKKIINVELPLNTNIQLTKFSEFHIELYYNSVNFKSYKFPFSIKII